MKQPLCKTCGGGHYKSFCYQNRKPIKQQGKHAKKWQATRKDWFSQNVRDNYQCYICGKLMTPQETTLDHVKPRSSRPDLRYDMTNLKPCCWTCNSVKGSTHTN